MGVPKFFRFISERYPCISELIPKDTHTCEFDNLYLDMNGIIHMCSHPDDNNPHFRITEEKIYRDVFHYISYLFQVINPRKVFFMAIDGVAPRAKMNQQRCRRFQSAREAQESLKKALENGEVLPDTKRFDSNCITPGTVFMARLHEQLRYFVKHKITTDRAWAKCKIILSGHETPGEGEHKIMDYIRYLKTQPDHDPNTRHCLYGLDADLIMLGFCAHEPNFSILREEVIFKKNVVRPTTPDENNFYLLHLSLMKDYLEIEFSCLKETLPFEFDMEKLIDDWVLMGFLVGNDFIPNLPNLMINKNALPQLYDVYKEVLPTLDGYINENGILNLKRFETYLIKLSELDKKQFEEIYADLKYFEGKTGRRMNAKQRRNLNHVPDDKETFDVDVEEIKGSKKSVFQNELQDLIKSTNRMALDSEEEDLIDFGSSDDEEKVAKTEDEMFNIEFMLHKKDYYMTKLEYPSVTEEVLKSQAECYIRAIQWILNYYYQGCSSWSWYYPHHYAPYLSDVINFTDMELSYQLGKPFKPFEQLLGVLPVASKELLPESYHDLMTSTESPIYHYYPTEFETDLNGKLQHWEAVVLIPFIDEEKLLSAMQPYSENLSEDEKKRNTHGPMLIYEYTTQSLGDIPSPAYFPVIRECHAREVSVWVNDIIVDPSKVIRGALPNKYSHNFFPGVPTLKHIRFTTTVTKAKVKIFDYASRNDNFILDICPTIEKPSLELLASNLLGKIVWVGWPYLMEAKVSALCNKEHKISYIPEGKNDQLMDDKIQSIIKNENNGKMFWQWSDEKAIINKHYMARLGINVGEIDITVHAVSVKGYKYVSSVDGKLVCSVEWCVVPVLYPLQTVITDLQVAPIARPKLYKSISEGFPIDDFVFVIVGPYYGSMAKVVDSQEVNETGRIKVDTILETEPIINIPTSLTIKTYLPVRVAAAKCGISTGVFARITSSVYIVPKEIVTPKKTDRNINIGLGLKFTKTEEEVMGFTHRVDRVWFYSMRCIALVTDYTCRFYEMFQKLERFIEMENIYEQDIAPDDNEGKNFLGEVVDWIKAQSFKNYPTRKCSTIGLDPEELRYIHDTVKSQLEDIDSQKKVIHLKVKPHVLFKAELRLGNIPPDLNNVNFQLFDRVINVNTQSSVPLGYKGTIVSIFNHNEITNSVKITDNFNTDPTYLVQFDKAFPHGTTVEGVPGNRFYIMRGFNLLNITAGRLVFNKTNNIVQINNNSTGQQQQQQQQPQQQQQQHNPINSFSEQLLVHVNNISNLRPNDGHNSAFANYSNPVKVQPEQPAYTKIMQRPIGFEVPPFQVNMVPLLMKHNKQQSDGKMQNLAPQCNAPKTLPDPTFHLPLNQPAFKSAPKMEFYDSIKNHSNSNADSETNVLKSLLKIPQSPNNKAHNNSHNSETSSKISSKLNKTQEFYRTPPSRTQIPFPAKFIDDNFEHTNTTVCPKDVITAKPNTSNKLGNYVISTPFVPLQVTKKKVMTESKNVIKTSETTSIPKVDILENIANSNNSSVQKIEVDSEIAEKKRKSKNRRRPKSRIAANFDKLNN